MTINDRRDDTRLRIVTSIYNRTAQNIHMTRKSLISESLLSAVATSRLSGMSNDHPLTIGSCPLVRFYANPKY